MRHVDSTSEVRGVHEARKSAVTSLRVERACLSFPKQSGATRLNRSSSVRQIRVDLAVAGMSEALWHTQRYSWDSTRAQRRVAHRKVSSHHPPVAQNDIVVLAHRQERWMVVAPVNGSKADIRRKEGFDTGIVTAPLESLTVIQRAGKPGLWLLSFQTTTHGPGFELLLAMRTPANAQTVVVGIFDNPQSLDLAVLRLASEDIENTVYHEAFVAEGFLKTCAGPIAVCSGRLADAIAQRASGCDSSALVLEFKFQLYDYQLPDEVIEAYATIFGHNGKFVLIEADADCGSDYGDPAGFACLTSESTQLIPSQRGIPSAPI